MFMHECVFDVFVSLLCLMRVPAALRHPQEKHTPGFLEHELHVFYEVGVITNRYCRCSAKRHNLSGLATRAAHMESVHGRVT